MLKLWSPLTFQPFVLQTFALHFWKWHEISKNVRQRSEGQTVQKLEPIIILALCFDSKVFGSIQELEFKDFGGSWRLGYRYLYVTIVKGDQPWPMSPQFLETFRRAWCKIPPQSRPTSSSRIRIEYFLSALSFELKYLTFTPVSLIIHNTHLLLARFCGLGVAPFPFPVQFATSKWRFCWICSALRGDSGLVALGLPLGSALWWWCIVFLLVCTDIGCRCFSWPFSGTRFSDVVELNLRHVLFKNKKRTNFRFFVETYRFSAQFYVGGENSFF